MTCPTVTASETQALLDRISKARAWLVINQPFLATLALGMTVTVTRKFDTAAASYDTLYFNPDFCAGLDDSELLFLTAHEVFHPMFEHNSRRMGRDPELWNMAADYVINEHLHIENVGRMPQGGLYDSPLFRQGGGSTDAIYDLLQKQQQQNKPKQGQGQGQPQQGQGQGQPQQGQGQAPWKDIVEEDGAPAETAQKEADMKVRISQAAQAAKMAGKLSAGMKRLFDEALAPRIDWRDVLRDFMVKARSDDRSYARPNRRFMSQGMIIPSVSGEAMGTIVVAVDCSGSVSEKALAEFAAEISAIHDEVLPVSTHVVYFDHRVCHHDIFERHDTVSIAPHGGGGTAFSPVFRYIDREDIQPVACVFLTDLQCGDFGREPEYPVLWVSTDRQDAPFGQIIKL